MSIQRLSFSLLWLVVLWIPMENAIVVPGVGTLVRLLGGGALGVTLLTCVLNGKVRRLNSVHYLMLFLAGVGALTILWSRDPDLSAARVGTFAQLLGLVWLIWELAREHQHHLALIQAYVIGGGIASISTIATFAGTAGLAFSYDPRYVAWGFDPNDLGLMLAIGIPMAWFLSTKATSRVVAFLYQSYFVVAGVAILLTGSRGATISAVVGACFVLMTAWKTSLRAKLSVIMVSVLLAYSIPFLVPVTSLSRLSTTADELLGGNLNYRTVIWRDALNQFVDHPLTGVGVGAYQPEGGPVLVVHNAFLSVLVEQGLVGGTIFVALILTLVMRIRRLYGVDRLMWLFAMTTWVVGVQALSWEFRKPTWLLLGLLTAYTSRKREAGVPFERNIKVEEESQRAQIMARSHPEVGRSSS